MMIVRPLAVLVIAIALSGCSSHGVNCSPDPEDPSSPGDIRADPRCNPDAPPLGASTFSDDPEEDVEPDPPAPPPPPSAPAIPRSLPAEDRIDKCADPRIANHVGPDDPNYGALKTTNRPGCEQAERDGTLGDDGLIHVDE